MDHALGVLHRETVRPEWIDGNGHMNLAYYVVVFDHATDGVLDHFDLGDAYRTRSGRTLFVAETHTVHERELRAGDTARVASWLLAADAKRLHFCHAMSNEATGVRACMQELLALHVDLATRRTATFGDGVCATLNEALCPRAKWPGWVGRRISMGPRG